MRSRRWVALLVLAAIVVSAGCTQRIIDFTIISSKNVDLSRADGFKRSTERVTGEDVVMIIFIPLGTPNVKEAVDRAIEKVPGAVALVDGVINYKYVYLIFGSASYIVEGTPLIDPALAQGQEPETPYMVSYLDPASGEAQTRYVSAEDYTSIKRAMASQDAASLETLLD